MLALFIVCIFFVLPDFYQLEGMQLRRMGVSPLHAGHCRWVPGPRLPRPRASSCPRPADGVSTD